MSGVNLSPATRLRLAIILADQLRETRRQLRLAGRAEPPWLAELAALADQLRAPERDGVTRSRSLSALRSRRYRARKAAERDRQHNAGAA